MKITPRDQIIIGVVVIVLLVVGLAMVLVRPQLAELGSVGAEQEKQQKAITSVEGAVQLLKAAKSEALQTEADLLRVQNQVPDNPQVPSLVVEIQDLANDAGIEFSSIKPSPMAALGEYTTLPMLLELKGQYFDVVDFLYRLQHLTREVRVTDVVISSGGQTEAQGVQPGSPAGEEESTAMLEVSLTANAFIMGTVPGAQAPSPTTPGAGGTTGGGGAPSSPPAGSQGQ